MLCETRRSITWCILLEDTPISLRQGSANCGLGRNLEGDLFYVCELRTKQNKTNKYVSYIRSKEKYLTYLTVCDLQILKTLLLAPYRKFGDSCIKALKNVLCSWLSLVIIILHWLGFILGDATAKKLGSLVSAEQISFQNSQGHIEALKKQDECHSYIV